MLPASSPRGDAPSPVRAPAAATPVPPPALPAKPPTAGSAGACTSSPMRSSEAIAASTGHASRHAMLRAASAGHHSLSTPRLEGTPALAAAASVPWWTEVASGGSAAPTTSLTASAAASLLTAALADPSPAATMTKARVRRSGSWSSPSSSATACSSDMAAWPSPPARIDESSVTPDRAALCWELADTEREAAAQFSLARGPCPSRRCNDERGVRRWLVHRRRAWREQRAGGLPRRRSRLEPRPR